ncbi:R2-like ligand-binding oxidase [Thermus oshimai]|jgi:ribonucleoside-diphosphate reductase beta chain|uniref:R2-like ligand-binding oxidase n=1 Tax=Thermus TaxID=270 RepID=UPI000361E684|nr:R2-like ligand-binding oxidase [Thermus oshimai]
MIRNRFKTTTEGLRPSFPLTLYGKAKRFFWDPAGLDFSQDRASYTRLAPEARTALTHLASLFIAGEEAVTLDLLPLLGVVAREGRLEEEMYLTTFLLDEAKHVEFFHRLLEAMGSTGQDLERFHGPSYRAIFYQALPQAMGRLVDDPSPEAQVEAVVTYTMVVEGVLAETGYYAYRRAAKVLGGQGFPLPATLEGIGYVARDESRHIAYGLYLLSRLLAQNPQLWNVVERRMDELLPHALGVVGEVFAQYPGGFPLPLSPEEFFQYAMGQFQKRHRRLEVARRQSLEEVERLALEEEA